VDGFGAVLHRMAEVGVAVDDVDRTLEEERVASLHQSFTHALLALEATACQLAPC
jgi:hypothetical protein